MAEYSVSKLEGEEWVSIQFSIYVHRDYTVEVFKKIVEIITSYDKDEVGDGYE